MANLREQFDKWDAESKGHHFNPDRDWIVWQAATEAAKATGTAGKQPLLPEAHDVKGPHGWLEYYTADQMREYALTAIEFDRKNRG